jgi:hypothetical protein
VDLLDLSTNEEETNGVINLKKKEKSKIQPIKEFIPRVFKLKLLQRVNFKGLKRGLGVKLILEGSACQAIERSTPPRSLAEIGGYNGFNKPERNSKIS